MLLLDVALPYCRLPRESQVLRRLEPTWEGRWTSVVEYDLALGDVVPKFCHYPHRNCPYINHRSSGTGKATCHPIVSPPKWVDRLSFDAKECTPHTHPRNIRLIGTARNLVVYATDGAASKGETTRRCGTQPR
jgi:hypothetical protein